MDLLNVPVGKDVQISVSVGNGKISVRADISLEPEINALFEAAKLKFPAIAEILDKAEKAADVALEAA